MKITTFIITLLFSSILGCFSSVAQNEFMNNSNKIPPLKSGLNTPSIVAPSVFSPSTKTPTKSNSILEPNKIQFMQNNQFVNAGEATKDNLNERKLEFTPDFTNKNMDFGVFKTKSEYVRICYRDYNAVDGDMVEIYTTDVIIVPSAILDAECQYAKLGLLKGANVINFQALNEGQGSPNTGEMQVFDDKGVLITANRWGLETGFIGTVTIYKE